MELTYTRIGDYFLPNIILNEPPPNRLATILDREAAHEIILAELVYC